MPVLLFPPFLIPPSLALLAVRVVGFPVRVSLSFACSYAIQHGLCVPRARSGRPSDLRRVLVACVCALTHPRCSRSSPLVGVARAPRAVSVQGAGRAVPCGSCPSAFLALVPCCAFLAWGGWPGPRVSLPDPGSLFPSGVGPCVRGGLVPEGT